MEMSLEPIRADAVERELERIVSGSGHILVGPWISEVGYEVLYWVPFLRWLKAAYRIPGDRIVVMSAHPGCVRAVYDVDLPRPRTSATRALPAFVGLAQELWVSLKPQWQDQTGAAAWTCAISAADGACVARLSTAIRIAGDFDSSTMAIALAKIFCVTPSDSVS